MLIITGRGGWMEYDDRNDDKEESCIIVYPIASNVMK